MSKDDTDYKWRFVQQWTGKCSAHSGIEHVPSEWSLTFDKHDSIGMVLQERAVVRMCKICRCLYCENE
jgi:hypothetical protein